MTAPAWRRLALSAAVLLLAVIVVVAWRAVNAPHGRPLPIPPSPPAPLMAPAIALPGVPREAGAQAAAAQATAPAAAVVPVPAVPRALPFVAGEEARYQLLWTGGGAVNLPAGEAVFRVEEGAARAGRPGYRFELLVSTAAWISAFFEARDRFWSLTGPALEPLVHVQELNEGRRHLTRTMTFDAGRGRVIVGTGPPEAIQEAVEFPWVPAVRDPLGAFYEARAIDPSSTARHAIPVNNVGQSLTLVIGVAGSMTITAEGRTQSARLLEVRLDEAGSQDPAPTARVWLSADSRRIPLAIDVEASFGSFRAELQAYRRSVPAPAR